MVQRWGMDGTTKGLGVVALAVWGVAGFFALNPSRPAVATAASTTPASPMPAPSPSTVPEEPSSSPNAPPSAATAHPRGCLARAFPAPTFTDAEAPVPADFCTQTNPLGGSGDLKAALVKDAAGSENTMTAAMAEWVGLGWYQLAAYQVLRTRCCPTPPAYEWPFSLACPMDKAMKELGEAVASREQAAIEGAIEKYWAQAVCLDKFGQSQNFGQTAPPASGRSNLERLLARVP